MVNFTCASLSLLTDNQSDKHFSVNMENDTYKNYTNATIAEDMQFGPVFIIAICCYSVVFLLSSVGNVTMLLILLRNLKKTKLNRVYILLLNLNFADLIVTFCHIPKEIVHAATVQWLAPDWLCRFTRYLDVFGVYLSSNILICMSIDRFFAIVRPLDNFKARKRVRIMVVLAWLIAASSSLPQIYTFCKAQHPNFPWYHQCISALFGQCGMDALNYVIFNTMLNALEIYVLPFIVIVFCYGTIMSTIVNEEKHVHNATSANECSNDSNEPKVQLRRSSHCYIRRAKSKTLRMTVVIVTTFLVCWTPYFVMVAIHFADINYRTGMRYNRIAMPWVLERCLYIFAIFNSCINPYLYGYYSFKLRLELLELGRKCCGKGAAYRNSRYFSAGSPALFEEHHREPRYSRGLSLDLSHTDNHMVRFKEGFLLMERSIVQESDHSQS